MFQKSQINSFKGCQIVGLDSLVKVDLLGGKSNPQQGRVTKLTLNSRVMIFKNGKGYFNMVNRRLQKQHEGSSVLSLLESSASGGVWEPGPRAWGERIPNSPFIVHKDKEYLECIFLRGGNSIYMLDGVEIPKSEIQGLPTKSEGEQGGLVDKVIIRTYSFESILKIRKSKVELVGPVI
jgi:hypothetical protein